MKTATPKPARRPASVASRSLIRCGLVEDLLPKVASGTARLAYVDPPFNIKRNYDEANDNLPIDEYRRRLLGWLHEAYRVLVPGGVLVVNVPDQHAAMVDINSGSMGFVRLNWCIWHYRFGQNTLGSFVNSKVHVLIYRKGDEPHVWNWKDILVPSDRAAVYGDKRTRGKRDGSPDGMRVPLDVWQGAGFSRITGNNAERRALHDNQIPIAYLKRVVLAYSNPGDLVIDMFTGSGTMPLVSATLGRRVLGFELSKQYVKSARARVADRAQQALVTST